MPHVRVNGVAVEYDEYGTGVPVVFSHGRSSDLRYWSPQRNAFAANYRFVTYTRRRDASAETHVDDLLAIARRLEAGPVHLVGFSTRSRCGRAVREPELHRSLTIVEPNVPWVLEGDDVGESLVLDFLAEHA